MLRIFGRRVHLVVAASVMMVLTAAAIAYAVSNYGGSGTVTRMISIGQDTATTTNSTAFVPVPTASTTIYVPTGETALLVARFTAESQCSGDGGGNWCSVRITANGTEMAPAAGQDFAFDAVGSPTSASDLYESHSVERSMVVSAGTYVVRVEQAVTSATTVLRLDDWTLTVMRGQRSAG